MEDELTAWHEAGHAWAAIVVGAKVRSVTIEPDNDDGPRRFGDTVVVWSRGRFTETELSEKSAWVALAGPVAEMLHTGRPFHPAVVAEWQQDWDAAVNAMAHVRQVQRRIARLEQITVELYQAFQEEQHWSAVAAIADHLLAHETLDHDMLLEAVEPWLE